MNHWWRAYDSAVDHAKLLLLSDKQHRAWFNLMCCASENGGALPELKVLALKLRMSPAKVEALLADLKAALLFDETEEGKFTPHNWNDRQFKSDVSTPRVKRFREAQRNVSSAVSETHQRQSTETEKKDSEPKGSGEPPKVETEEAKPDLKAEFFRRGRVILGPSSGGLLSKLLRSFGNEDDPKAIAKAMARIYEASSKAKPAEWIGRVLAPKGNDFKLMSGMEGVV